MQRPQSVRTRCCFLFERRSGVKASRGCWCWCSLVVRWCSFLFRRSGARRVFVGAVSASQFHAGPSGGQKAAGACRGRIGPPWGGGLEGLLAREDVPGGDQDLARDGGLGGVLAGAGGDVGVELMPGVACSPGVLGGFDGGPAQRVAPANAGLTSGRYWARTSDLRLVERARAAVIW